MDGNKIILLTGGTGSFGVGFIKLLLSKPEIEMIRVYSRNVSKQNEVRDKFKTNRVSFYIGDVRDFDRLKTAMEDCNYVVHAAALKHVPLGEVDGGEFIKTNVIGTMNVIDASQQTKIEKCLLISTDKAVEPINLYGATKMLAERLFLQADKLRGFKPTRFSCVRYGNVVGSSGSLVETILKAKPKDIIPITEFNSTRFWLTVDMANQFAWDSLINMVGGEILIPKNLKSCTVYNFVNTLKPHNATSWVGLRPGDKLHEKLDEGVTSNTAPRLTRKEIIEYAKSSPCLMG